jgi:hypothetical protein
MRSITGEQAVADDPKVPTEVPGIRLMEDVPVRMMALTSLRYWGLTKAINRYLEMVRMEREATLGRIALEEVKLRLQNLPQILKSEQIKIDLELAALELAREIATFSRRSSLAEAELLAEQNEQRLAEFRARNNPGEGDEVDPTIAKLQAFLKQRKTNYDFLEKTKQQFAEARGGEENLTDYERDTLADLAEKIEQALTVSEDGRG